MHLIFLLNGANMISLMSYEYPAQTAIHYYNSPYWQFDNQLIINEFEKINRCNIYFNCNGFPDKLVFKSQKEFDWFLLRWS